MKTSFTFLVMAIFLSVISQALFATISPFASNDEKEGEKLASKLSDYATRGFLKFKFYSYDFGGTDYKLAVSGTFGKPMDDNSQTDTINFHNIYGAISYSEIITIERDDLGRDTAVTYVNNEGGGPNFAIKQKMVTSYFGDSRKITRHDVFGLNYTFGLMESTEKHYDENTNQTFDLTRKFIPETGEIYSASGDSTEFYFDSLKRVVSKIHLDFQQESEDWKPTEKKDFAYSDNYLNSVVISELNEDRTVKNQLEKISDLEGMEENSFKYWRASSSVSNLFVSGTWIPNEKTETNRDNGRTISTSKWNGSSFELDKRTEITNFQRPLEKALLYISPRISLTLDDLRNVKESTYPGGQKNTFWETQNEIYYKLASEAAWNNTFYSEAENKSAAEGDSIMTLIHKVFDPGSGVWLEQYFKLEVLFESIDVADASEVRLADAFTLYPNPAKNLLNVKFNVPGEVARIDIINSIGQVVSSAETDQPLYQKNLSGFQKGMYFLKVYSGEGTATRKFLVQ